MRRPLLAIAGLGVIAGLAGCVVEDRYAYDGYHGRSNYAYSAYDRPYQRDYRYQSSYWDRSPPARWDYQRQSWNASRWDSSRYDAYRRRDDLP